MAKVSIVKRLDGGLCIARIARDKREDESDTEFLDACTRKIINEPDMPGYRGKVIGIFDESAVPADRYFRGAWTWNTPDPKVDIDIEKARDIHMVNLRRDRNRKLEELDKETMKVISDPIRLAEVEKQKQALRDMPETIKPQLESATTTDEIKAVKPF